MTEPLRDLFDQLVVDEPPLRMTSDGLEAAGQRKQRRKTLWTVAGTVATAAAVAAVIAVPTLIAGGGQGATDVNGVGGSGVGSASPSRTESVLASASPSPRSVTASRHCPGDFVEPAVDRTDGSVLPDPDRAAAAVVASGPGVAPGREFIVDDKIRIETSPKNPGTPTVFLIFDVGDAAGYGAINMQIMPEAGASPAERAQADLNRLRSCVDVTRRDFADGSVAIYYPYGAPAQEHEVVTHVFYYGIDGFTMNIGCFSHGWTSTDDPNVPPPAPSRPVRDSMPLTVDEIMEIADIVAHA